MKFQALTLDLNKSRTPGPCTFSVPTTATLTLANSLCGLSVVHYFQVSWVLNLYFFKFPDGYYYAITVITMRTASHYADHNIDYRQAKTGRKQAKKYLFCNHSNRELLMNTLYAYEIGFVPIAVFLVLKLPCY